MENFPKNLSLTAKQKDVLAKIRQYLTENNQSPTISELKEMFGKSSSRTITQYLQALETKGFIKRVRYKRRGIKLMDEKETEPKTIMLPVVGVASCGSLGIIASHVFDEFINIDKHFLHGEDSNNVVAVRAIGKSMIDAGIDDKDYIITYHTNDAANGDKVVAIIDGMAVVKKFFKTNNAVILNPMSKDPQYSPIVMKEDFEIFGKVIDVIKYPKDIGLTYEPIQ